MQLTLVLNSDLVKRFLRTRKNTDMEFSVSIEEDMKFRVMLPEVFARIGNSLPNVFVVLIPVSCLGIFPIFFLLIIPCGYV